MLRKYYFVVYLLCSKSRRALYCGMTNSAMIRVQQHREAGPETFAGRYRTHRLVYFETFQYVSSAIRREKQIKGWTQKRKEELINSVNPEWKDLSAEWGKPIAPIKQTQGPSAKGGPQDDSRGAWSPDLLSYSR